MEKEGDEYPFPQPADYIILAHPATHEILEELTKKGKITSMDIERITRGKLESKKERDVSIHALGYTLTLLKLGVIDYSGFTSDSEKSGRLLSTYMLNRERLTTIRKKLENLTERLKKYETSQV